MITMGNNVFESRAIDYGDPCLHRGTCLPATLQQLSKERRTVLCSSTISVGHTAHKVQSKCCIISERRDRRHPPMILEGFSKIVLHAEGAADYTYTMVLTGVGRRYRAPLRLCHLCQALRVNGAHSFRDSTRRWAEAGHSNNFCGRRKARKTLRTTTDPNDRRRQPTDRSSTALFGTENYYTNNVDRTWSNPYLVYFCYVPQRAYSACLLPGTRNGGASTKMYQV